MPFTIVAKHLGHNEFKILVVCDDCTMPAYTIKTKRTGSVATEIKGQCVKCNKIVHAEVFKTGEDIKIRELP